MRTIVNIEPLFLRYPFPPSIRYEYSGGGVENMDAALIRVTCDNGQKANVAVRAKGGGLTFGKSEMKDVTGKFTEVDDISKLFGGYAQGEAHAGAGESAKAGVVTKGEISLAFSGTGKGVDVGIAFGSFHIEKAGAKKD